MAQNPPNDPAANHAAHMERVRASQRRSRCERLTRALRHYNALPGKSPLELQEHATVRRDLDLLHAEMRAAGQEP